MSTEADVPILQFKPPQDETFLKWSLMYPRNPRFHYLYPSPTVTTITNIANALAACPKFYVQVLHLMNKMNLPAPFGQPTPIPPIPNDEPIESSSESELESDTEIALLQKSKAKKKNKKPSKAVTERPKKRIKLIDDFATFVTKPVEHSKVFDLDQSAASQKQIQLNIPAAIKPTDAPDNIEDVAHSAETVSSVQTGFGLIEPVPKQVAMDQHQEMDECSEFISSKELRKGKMSESKRQELSIFKRYSKGEPSSRLYIKNLSKQTTEKDLKYIYGKYIDWSNNMEVNAFDVRVMKEGRMKGQAFVTLPAEEAAVKALEESHAFILNDKPMVVQFARSAKANADPNTEDK